VTPLSDEEAFARLVDALRPWLPEVLIIGGWAHRLHRLHGQAAAPRYIPVLTRDVDVAFRLDDPPQGSMAVALRDADFQEELSGEHLAHRDPARSAPETRESHRADRPRTICWRHRRDPKRRPNSR